MSTRVPCTPYQWMQLLGTRLSADPYSGFLGRALDLGPGLSVADGRLIAERLLRRHAALRVRFLDEEGHIAQDVRPWSALPAGLSAPDPLPGPPVAAVPGLPLQTVFPEPPDPFGDHPAQARLVTDTAGHLWLCLLVHHAQVDAHSMGRLVASAAEEAAAVATTPGPAPVPAAESAATEAYTTAVRALNARSAEDRAGAAEYWREQYGHHTRFADMSAPGPAPRGPARAALSADDVRALMDAGRRLNATPTMLAHTALVALAHRHLPDAVVPVGVPMSLRDLDGVGFDDVGLCINVLPAVVPVPEGASLTGLLAAVRRKIVELQEFKYLPLWRTIELSGLRRSDLAHRQTTMFAVTLAVHIRRTDAVSETAATLVSAAPPVPGMHLDVSLAPGGGTVALAWRPDSPPLRPPDELLAEYVAVLRQLAADATAPVAALTAGPGAPPDLADRETVLAAVLAGVEEVTGAPADAERSFFDAGGNSMTVARLAALLRRKGLRLKVRDIFEHPVPEDLSAVLAERHAARTPA